MLKPRSPIATAEADLAALLKRGAGLAQRRDAAVAALATATAERRRLLTETDDPSAADLAKVDRAVRDATDARDAAVDAVAAVDGRAAEVRAAIEALKASAERERHAAAIEASAKAADFAIERMRKAAGELDSARRDLAAALLPEAVPCYAPPNNSVPFGVSYLGTTLRYDARGNPEHDTLNVEQLAARIAGHLITGALPGLGIAREEDVTGPAQLGQITRILGPVDGDVARSIITDPMRAAAGKVRDGAPDALPTPLARFSGRETRQRAGRWHGDVHGRFFDDQGRRVNDAGLYLTEAETADFDRVHRLSPFSAEAAREQARKIAEKLHHPSPEAA